MLMDSITTFRCEKCRKVLRSKTEETGKTGKCPFCGTTLTMPDPVLRQKRKHARALAGESSFFRPLPESLLQASSPPLYRVMYTEVPPAEFLLKRSSHVPLLDLGEGGMGFFVRADEKSREVFPGQSFVVEVDFPIFVQPIFVEVKVCWTRSGDENKVLHVGVKFVRTDELLTGFLQNLINYISSRTEAVDLDKWGSFG